MKRLLLLLSLVGVFFILDSCTKTKDPEPLPVVGKWASDRIRLSGFPTAYATYNGQELDAYDAFGVRESFELKNDKTFTGTDRSGGTVVDYDGNWEYVGTQLTLKYSKGGEDKLEHDATKKQLLSSAVSVQDSIANPTTKKRELVKFNLQLVYSKQ